MINDKWLRRQYVEYNKKVFHDLLPPDLPVHFADLKENAGMTYFDGTGKDAVPVEISIDTYLRKLPKYARIVLLHEMAHCKVGYQERHLHGPLWKAERKRLIDAGAFTPLL